MITDQEAKDLMVKLIELRSKAKDNNSAKIKHELNTHLELCMDKFKYLVMMRTSKYKAFSNYDDLNQEGFEALLRAMKTYKPSKGGFFTWAHHYISTRISRSANLHTTIRFPMKVAKAMPPHKELIMPERVEEGACPSDLAEANEDHVAVTNVLSLLTEQQKMVIDLAYGFDGDKPMSINKICQKLDISRNACLKMINGALATMRAEIKI